jgi:hypothetical protein
MAMHDDESTNDPMDSVLDDRLRAMASESYNAADGAVPRDAMWSRISAARRAARVAPAIGADEQIGAPAIAPAIVPLRRGRSAAWRWSAVLAAGLILGVVVGRQLARRSDVAHDRPNSSGRVAATSVQPVQPATPTNALPVTPSAPQETRDTRHGASSSNDRATTDVAVNTPRHDDEHTRAASTESASVAPDARDLYHAAAVQTLVQAEALLTAYRANGDATRDPQAMQQAAHWARDVLSSTRLLMDSPAARDPKMRALFTDLELVLAQIVQLSGAPLQAAERDLIERAMRERDLLPRLRTAVPAGLATS